ncbi:NACHT domain-containing protein [Nostoc sp. UCD121]|uniref:NB-ARC domain-containing protein n=1 Tax=unclassified Nostoc TaxID=2593658 RepID=UPI00162AA764|nr:MULTISPECIES: NB-ARC domain-containing protein [unclassified Nostoc]MBC1218595.1 NACHT domain-containing protein [Nostoc sp. UCD120]MBC1278988.1 NACHT domain-containing protein [Nostoc sp. UCD121]MBC1294832.1 NACHT domain-containing protein [Nostoc sp. UCD122]
MSNSLKASTAGLAIIEKSRQRLGWTKTSTARWWQDAHTSRATLRRFWQGDRIQREIFIAICQAVGIGNWEAIAELSNADLESAVVIPTPYLDCNEAPDLESFYGRNQELAQLEEWITSQKCKFVTINGIAGIGKTALALALVDRIQSKFDCLIWKSLQTSPSLISLLNSLLNSFEEGVVQNIQQGTAQLIQQLQKRRCLLVLDGLEAIFSQPENLSYSQFIQQLSRERHQSCILISNREQPKNIEINTKTSRCLNLKGLPKTEARELLQSRGFTGKELGLSALIQLYRGNPLALKLVTPLIQSVFGGNVVAFLSQNTLIVGDRLRVILKQQFEQLSGLEQDILYWLAIWQEPVSFSRLQTHLLISVDPAMVLEGIVALERRSLLEKWISDYEPSFTLQPLVMKVVTDELVEHTAQEIYKVMQSNDIRHFQILRTHWLLRPGTDDIAGDRILTQLWKKLWHLYGATLPQIFNQILLLLNGQSPLAIGYIKSNVAILSGIESV